MFRNVRLIETFSEQAAGCTEDKVDYIFIDGDHSYKGLQKDWQLYSCNVVEGGYMLLHDTNVPFFDP